ncbi:hypothetical protein F53441_3260 [Fusarium austroafricanum]|uniref:Uncharacterized protein n=1 Tax=Fusarium austroafricanum TaxID=2364996 RepID=A0A8H4NWY3_9HYPO|nr:hypothetical protein F53441_3260 [Fusarium austroafricanum]
MPKSPRDAVTKYLSDHSKPLRPIFTSLNGDNSWLMSFPRPESEQAETGKIFYHLAFEPWLKGPALVFNQWIVHIARTENSGIAAFADLENLIREIEQAAASRMPPKAEGQAIQQGSASPLDGVLLSFFYSDHLHPETLKTFPPEIPIIATPPGAAIIKAWNHFHTVKIIKDFSPLSTSWKTPDLHPGDPVPSWFTPIMLLGKGELNFVFTIIWSHTVDGQEVQEAIFDSPHGVHLDAPVLEAFLASEPKTKKLAMLHGLKESHSAGVQTTFGAKGGLGLHRKVGGVEHWVSTHSAEMKYTGVLMTILWTVDTPRTIEWALNEEQKENPTSKTKPPNIIKVPNGGSTILTCQ